MAVLLGDAGSAGGGEGGMEGWKERGSRFDEIGLGGRGVG